MGEQLGEFLRARRAALTPAASGVPTYGQPRRVPGLRRDEVAQLAGISVNYYTRLEQGESHQMSDSVLESLGTALRLSPAERGHLLRLARPQQVVRREFGPEQLRPSVLALVTGAVDQAAVIVGRHFDLLGANRLGYALFGHSPDQPVNLVKVLFLDPAAQALYPDWEHEAVQAAAYLRMATGDMPDDPALAELVGELSIKSKDFARIWSAQPVMECTHKTRRVNHPLVGPMTLTEESLRLPDDPGQRLIFLSAAAGTDSADRLRLLDSLSASSVSASEQDLG
ncbi:transcriptional regulator with XRE-family HTH domain [Crossiella equi]|uniref:Transcriptional regulator with XRE-family HTH domain n=1 Tax=Crossiella equi TaxID=130796 RepID=A0ABS5ACM3_9PSEU|nr:helix-turn-helix transcriptional regulator [Crossiella equi]MBP2474333.1 transcriptional regulator with XRE-family HTH domain [Crossiella equi]